MSLTLMNVNADIEFPPPNGTPLDEAKILAQAYLEQKMTLDHAKALIEYGDFAKNENVKKYAQEWIDTHGSQSPKNQIIDNSMDPKLGEIILAIMISQPYIPQPFVPQPHRFQSCGYPKDYDYRIL